MKTQQRNPQTFGQPIYLIIGLLSILNFLSLDLAAQRLQSCAYLMAGKPKISLDPKTAVGIRVDNRLTLTYKKYFGHRGNAFEASLGAGYFGDEYLSIGISLIHHEDAQKILDRFDLPSVDNLSYYYGGGVVAYFWNYTSSYRRRNYGWTSYGVQLNLGAEYEFEDYPIIIGIDWVPSVSFGNKYYSNLRFRRGNLVIRYILKDK